MSRRFQFSLGRLLVATALACAAAACFRIGAEGPLENAVIFHSLMFALTGCALAVIARSRRRGMSVAVLGGVFAGIVWGSLLAVWK